MLDILNTSILDVSTKLASKAISPVELVGAALTQIHATEQQLSAYVRTLDDSAMAEARSAEQELMKGRMLSPLHGVPVAVKDLYDMKGVPTTASSKVRQHWLPKDDSAVVRRLKALGAIIVGKTHTHEFAYGIMTPTTGNPWDPTRTPGGSSGGSAATVAARGVFMAMGTDTGGSIRIPSAQCGVVGIKPTYGRVSRAGITPLSWSLDHAGPITRTVADAALCLELLSEYDPADSGSLNARAPVRAQIGQTDTLDGITIGIPTNYFTTNVDDQVAAAIHAAARHLESLGARLVPIVLPLAQTYMAMEYTILMPEATNYHHTMLRSKAASLYGDDVHAFLIAGECISAAEYLQAQRLRTLLRTEFKALFTEIDAILAPSVALPPVMRSTELVKWPDGSEEDIVTAYTRFAQPGNITGFPSLSVPCGFTTNKLPIGLQVLGAPLSEPLLFRIGLAYENTTNWHLKLPMVV